MTEQSALELARDRAPAGTLSFALQYFGAQLGYMGIMLNGTCESFMPSAAPNYFWDFFGERCVIPGRNRFREAQSG